MNEEKNIYSKKKIARLKKIIFPREKITESVPISHPNRINFKKRPVIS